MKVTVSAPGMNPSADADATGSAAQGTETEEIDLADGAKVSDLLSKLGLGTAFSPELVLVNGDQVDIDTQLHEGDAIALGGEMGGM